MGGQLMPGGGGFLGPGVVYGGGAGEGAAISAGSTLASSGTVAFSNSNGVTFGMDGQTVTASVAPPAGGSINFSAGTTSNNLASVVFSNSNGVSFGLSAGTITAFVTAPDGIQSIFGGTTQVTSGQASFADSNGVSFGVNGQTITATVRTDYQSAGAYLTTAMQSNAATISNIKLSAGGSSANLSAVTFSNSNNVTFGLSGSTMTASVAPAIAGIQAGSQGASSGTVVFANSNGVTFGMSANSQITVSVAGVATSLTNINFSAGTTSENLSAVTFADSNGISFGLDTNSVLTATVRTNYQSSGAYLTTAMASNRGSDFVQAAAAFAGTNASGTIASNGVSVSVAATVAQTNQTVGLYASSNTYLTSSGTVDARSMSFRGDKSISVGISAGEVVFSVGPYLTTAMASNRGSDFVQAAAAFNGTNASGTIASGAVSVSVAAQTNQTVGLYASSNTYLTSSGTVDARSLSFRGDKSISVGISSGEVVFSVGPYLTTAMASNRGSDFVQAAAAFNGTNASGTIASGAISVSVAAPVAQTNQTIGLYASSNTYLTSSGTVDARSMSFRGDKSITVGVSSGEVVFSVGAYITTAMQSNAATISNIKLSAGAASANLSAVTFADSNGVSFGLNGSTITATVQTNYLTTAMQSNRGTDFVQATAAFAGTSASGTINSTGISVSIGPYITTAMLSNAATISNIKVSAGTSSTNLSAVTFSDGNGISFGLNGSVITGSIATSLSVVNFSAGAASANLGSVVFSNSNAVSFGLNGSTITGSYNFSVSAGTSNANMTNVVFSNSNNFSFGLNGSTITGGIASYLSYYRFPEAAGNTLTFSFAQSTSYAAPFVLPWYHSFDRMRVVASGSVAASSTQATTGNTSLSMSAITSHNLVFYSRGAGASSLSLQYVTSSQQVDKCLMTMSINANSTQYSVSLRYTLGSNSFTKDYSVSNNSLFWNTSHLTDLTGMKYLDLPLGISLSPGQYWLGYGRSTTFDTQNASISVATRMLVSHNSMLAISQNTLALGMLGGGTNSSVGWWPAHGSFTTSGGAGTTSSVEMSAVSTTGSNNVLYAQFMRIV